MFPILFRFPEGLPLLGGAPVTTFGIMVFVALVVGGLIMRSELGRMGYDRELTWDLVFGGAVGGILGAKLYYVFLHVGDPGATFFSLLFSRGGLVWYGALFGGVPSVMYQARKAGLPYLRVADGLAALFPITHAIGRVGCFLVGDDYGVPTALPVGIAFPQGAPPTTVSVFREQYNLEVDPEIVAQFGEVVPVHPTQLYEVVLLSLLFLFIWKIRDHRHKAGWLFGVWMIFASIERFVIEFLRAKDDRIFGVISTAQLVSLILIGVGIAVALHLRGPDGRRQPARDAG